MKPEEPSGTPQEGALSEAERKEAAFQSWREKVAQFDAQVRTLVALPQAVFDDRVSHLIEDWLDSLPDCFFNDPVYEGVCHDELRSLLQTYLDAMAPVCLATRQMLGRAVQPTGELNDLAPVIGAIRLDDRASAESKAYLAARVAHAVSEANSTVLKRLARLVDEPLGTHPNYMIWNAIREMLQKRCYQPSTQASAMFESHFDLRPDFNSRGDFRTTFFPDSKEVRAYVNLPKNSGRFLALQQKSDSQWTTLWQQSGAGHIVRKGKRGKGLH